MISSQSVEVTPIHLDSCIENENEKISLADFPAIRMHQTTKELKKNIHFF